MPKVNKSTETTGVTAPRIQGSIDTMALEFKTPGGIVGKKEKQKAMNGINRFLVAASVFALMTGVAFAQEEEPAPEAEVVPANETVSQVFLCLPGANGPPDHTLRALEQIQER